MAHKPFCIDPLRAEKYKRVRKTPRLNYYLALKDLENDPVCEFHSLLCVEDDPLLSDSVGRLFDSDWKKSAR